MSDVRALLADRHVELSDGAYLERLDKPVHMVEEFLRVTVAKMSFGRASRKGRFVHDVNAHEKTLMGADEAELKNGLFEAAKNMQRKGFEDVLLARSFATVREASRRILGKRHYDVQLLAGYALLNGKVAEMATGEGKTLAATLAVCTAAAVGAAVHVVTVNDYLAARDAEDNLPLYAFFGFSVGVVKQDMSIENRRAEYAKNIVYASNKELVFDYLKDRIALGSTVASQLKLRRLQGHCASPAILRGLHVAIVDEADSVLIDEARTPLIISETLPDELGHEIYHQAIALAGDLEEQTDYILGRNRDIWLTAVGEARVAECVEARGFEGVWKSPLWQKELINKALSAIHLFHRDQHYILAEDKVQIVDEFTGRVMPDRTWERGLHQMIEAKENCEITGQRRTLSQITYQRFFGRYILLAGMTGTAKEVEPELKRVYNLSATRIPTNKPTCRKRLRDRVSPEAGARWKMVASHVQKVANEGRPVLVGTRSVEASELLSELLNAEGVAHTVLNARQDKAEAEAVAKAGQSGQITIATNMAGRGTDIKLAPEVEERGGLHVVLTEFHESGRVDRQLFGRSARQGNPGSVEAIVSLDDELFRRYAPLLTRVGCSLWLKSPLLFRLLVFWAQKKSERQSRRIRLETTRRDRKWLQALGFVGTERK